MTEKKKKKKGKTMTEILDGAGETRPLHQSPFRTGHELENPLDVSHEEFQALMKKLEDGEKLTAPEKMKVRSHLVTCETCDVSDEAAEAYREGR